MTDAPTDGRLLPSRPRRSLEEHLAAGGGRALETALRMEPDEVVDEVLEAGLRGRGGAGFPTGEKWRSVRRAVRETDSSARLVVNGAEGEPGTYKDRRLLQDNPYLVLEGVLVARHAVGADQVHVGVKARSGLAPLLRRAVDEVVAAGWEDADVVQVVEGPDEYLFGEETALLEVVEGNLPLPRWLPPFQQGLFATADQPHPTVVNNVETLANVPVVLDLGAAGYRRVGTDDSPGTMLFTVVGDVEVPGVHELPLGTPLRELLFDVAGARDVMAVCNGVAAPVLRPEQLDVPLTYEHMRTAGTSLGSGGFVVYDHDHCIVRVAATLSRFLAVESCAQCAACKLGCSAITEWLEQVERGEGDRTTLRRIRERLPAITDQTRCALPAGEQLLVGSMLDAYHDEFVAHLGRTCDAPRAELVPRIEQLDDVTGEVVLDHEYHRKQPDWTYAPA